MESLSKENDSLKNRVAELENNLAHERAKKNDGEERLRIAYLSTMKSLVKSIEIKDPYTRGHYELVSKYAVAVGKRLDMGPEELDRVRLGALLMDIGKIAIDTALWTKKESLTEEEQAALREHIRFGAEITDPIVYPWNISEVIYQHHERYDGSGYPKGLRGDKILPEAQVLGICDSFLAMMADRAFRQAYSRDFAVNTIREESDRKFNARIVQAFVEVLENKENDLLDDFSTFFVNES